MMQQKHTKTLRDSENLNFMYENKNYFPHQFDSLGFLSEIKPHGYMQMTTMMFWASSSDEGLWLLEMLWCCA